MPSPIRYAEPGTIPHPGEVWRTMGCKTTLLTLHLLEAARIRPLLPAGLELVTPWPGQTVGGTLLTCYGPGSTLEYHELGLVAGWVRCGRQRGFYISHMYVDNAASVEGGRRMGYPKELATFDWSGSGADRVTVSQEGATLCTLRCRERWGRLRMPLAGTTLSNDNGKIFRFRHRVTADWSLARVALEIPGTSPLAALRLGQPLLALAGWGLTGDLGLDFEELISAG